MSGRFQCYTPGRRGMTLIELLVVISIIGMLMALSFPAIQAARETGRQTQCKNNLRQLGMAVHIHVSQRRIAPVSVGPYDEGGQPAANRSGQGWMVSLLPYLERQDLYLAFKLDGDFFNGGGLMHQDNRQLLATSLDILACPTDPASRELSTMQPEFAGIPVAVTNYKGVIGDTRLGNDLSKFPGTSPDCHQTSLCNGVFWRNTWQFPGRWDRFPDGTSQTFMIGEDLPEHNNWSMWSFANGDYATCHLPLNYLPDSPGYWQDAMGFRSYHPGGAHFCFADGSVRWVTDAIETLIYPALSTRDGKLNRAPGDREIVLSDDWATP